jgi:hypothetical protein
MHPYYTVPEMLQLLKEKNFSESALNLSSKQGMIDDTIKKHVATIRSGLNYSPAVDLTIEIPGHFDKRRDEVKFNFTFVYSNTTNKMRIQQVRAVLENPQGIAEASKLFLFADSKNLLGSGDMYEDLTKIRQTKALAVLVAISNKPLIKNMQHL